MASQPREQSVLAHLQQRHHQQSHDLDNLDQRIDCGSGGVHKTFVNNPKRPAFKDGAFYILYTANLNVAISDKQPCD